MLCASFFLCRVFPEACVESGDSTIRWDGHLQGLWRSVPVPTRAMTVDRRTNSPSVAGLYRTSTFSLRRNVSMVHRYVLDDGAVAPKKQGKPPRQQRPETRGRDRMTTTTSAATTITTPTSGSIAHRTYAMSPPPATPVSSPLESSARSGG